MRVRILAFLIGLPLLAADERQVALALQARTTFDRVNLAASPQLRDTVACIQAQATVLPVTPPEEQTIVRYRKAYCTLAGASVSRSSTEFKDASLEFGKAIDTWKTRVASRPKDGPLQPTPSTFRILAVVGQMLADPQPSDFDAATKQLQLAVDDPVCNIAISSPEACQSMVRVGQAWVGWIALKRQDLFPSARNFSNSGVSGWPQWLAGRLAFDVGNYREAAHDYQQAMDAWRALPDSSEQSLIQRLTPQPNLPVMFAEWGGAQLLSGDGNGAIRSLNEAIRGETSNARAIYLRGRAKELAGQMEGALADYNLASRTAFANASDLASGEAHLYRGVLLLRRKEVARAEDEFSSALNFDIPQSMRADAEAWRHMAAVENGSCATSRAYLERSLATVSPYFPKAEARSAMAACSASTTASIGGNALK